ncbi:hypothetical protein N3K66_001146 [Trichothecium roseum]|uniref:Uncharacterized protein n=1 Tax=Trichothecium roseum TaxID=47278 RepID=A0ACC0VDT6_9HYPO|nr:hypothetical protein N3K66_001146 [Trichothecium roseum]
MDFSRGSRRARHVAANGNGNGNASPGQGRLQVPAAVTTSRTPPAVTPENQMGDGRHQRSPVDAAPPPHPFRLHQTTRDPRLSMPPVDSDESSSEPDLSTLGRLHHERMAAMDHLDEHELQQIMDYEAAHDHDEMDEDMDPEEVNTSIEDGMEEDMGGSFGPNDDGDDEDVGDIPEPVILADPATMGLKEISNLAKFTVSSHKPGNGVEELRVDDLHQYWQSDGPQPHKLTVYFVKRVGIRDLRFYVNYNDDESYTPTKIIFKSGTSENNLIEFASMTLESPVGWQQVPLETAGGEPDGHTLVSYVLQMQILENHQNGKDTHLRGLKIYAFDPESGKGQGGKGAGGTNPVEDVVGLVDEASAAAAQGASASAGGGGGAGLSGLAQRLAEVQTDAESTGFSVPDFMKEPEIR